MAGKKKGGGKKKKAPTRWGDEDVVRGGAGAAAVAAGDATATAEQEGMAPKKRTRRYTQEDQDKERRLELRRRQIQREREFDRKMRVPNRKEVPQKPKKKRIRSKLMQNGLPSTVGEEHGGSSLGGSDVEADGVDFSSWLAPSDVPGNVGRDAVTAFEVRRMEEEGLDNLLSGSDEESSGGEEGNSANGGDTSASDVERKRADSGADSEEDALDDGTTENEMENDDNNLEGELELSGSEEDEPGVRDHYGTRFNAPLLPEAEADELLATKPFFKRLSPEKDSLRLEWKSLGMEAACAGQELTVDAAIYPRSGSAAKTALIAEGGLRPKLASHFLADVGGKLTKLQSLLLPSILEYRDVVYCAQRHEDWQQLRSAYLLHAVNHILKARSRVLRHNKRLRKVAAAEALAKAAESEQQTGETPRQRRRREKRQDSAQQEGRSSNGTSNGVHGLADEDDSWKRDQGFTRPAVLIVCPFRHLAFDMVRTILGLLGPDTAVSARSRFDEEFAPDPAAASEPPEGSSAKQKRDWMITKQKPADWHAHVGLGLNCDDDFKLGIAFTPGGGKRGGGVGVRLYADFYHSDLIIASPLGLNLVMGEAGRSGSDSDFLCGIEMCIVDGADVLAVQNWEHVTSLFARLNLMPKADHGIDFSRVRESATHGQSALLRQTLFLSALSAPQINSLVAKHLHNPSGALKVVRRWGAGSINGVGVSAELAFQRVKCTSAESADNARFEYFQARILEPLLAAKQSHTAIFVPSYFDFVRVRNALIRAGPQGEDAVFVSEYSRVSETARARARFFHGQRSPLVYTGRAHFFNRFRLRGIRHLIFFAPPEYPQFFPELVNLLEEGEALPTCLVLFTRYDAMSLQRIVGEKRADKMIKSKDSTFVLG
jgi:U3 small nucleolar RNA-associated protein 25